MYDTQDIYLSRLEPHEEIVTCPNCESYLVEHQDNFTYVCLDCLTEFSYPPEADEDSIPFQERGAEMLDQLFDFIVGWAMLSLPLVLGVLTAGIIETRRERRGR